MTILTRLALQRRSVTVLVIVLVLLAGLFTYANLERELFPEIEFPNILIGTSYPSGDPETVVRQITKPIEEAVDGTEGLREIRSESSENFSFIQLTFEFGQDMDEAERTVESDINGLDLPYEPYVYRLNSDTFPVLQLSVSGDRDIPSIQRVIDDHIMPAIDKVEGVFDVSVAGEIEEQVIVTVDTQKADDLGFSISQISNAIAGNNASFPSGTIDKDGSSFLVRTTNEFGSIEDLRDLAVGFEKNDLAVPVGGDKRGDRIVRLKDIASITFDTDEATTISRTNGKPSINMAVLKKPDANTVDVTEGIIAKLDTIEGLPPDVNVLVIQNDGPEVKRQLSSLLKEGTLGFLFAVSAVFIFLINIRPTLLRGVATTLRPTLIIGISIPLSVMTGILVMALYGLSLNFMSLAGLAIAVGRVVDDSIVVLENMYRHMQRGEDRYQAAVDGTKEVGAAIVSSTLTTVAVFVPLAFIQGLVGEFFTPFALSVSFALLASTLVALTAVPVLGVLLLREGDFPGTLDNATTHDTWLQRFYTPILMWSLKNRIVTLLSSFGVVLASLLLLLVIPITFFPAGSPEYITVDVELPTGTSIGRTFQEVARVESILEKYSDNGYIDVYQVSLGGVSDQFGPSAVSSGFHTAGFFMRLPKEGVPESIADMIREDIPPSEDMIITVNALSGGPPSEDLEITVVGPNFSDISGTAKKLIAGLRELDGIVNVSSDISDAKDEVRISVNPEEAAAFGLSVVDVGRQVNQLMVGSDISEIDIRDTTFDIVVKGDPDSLDELDELKNISIHGALGAVKLGSISDIGIDQGPVSISRFDLERSVTISGEITAEDTRAVGVKVDSIIQNLDMPPGVSVETGGIFSQIGEGFQDVFTAMLIGIILVYLVMVASLGSLRDPFIVVLSLPLAIVGALVALTVTDRTLSLSALMGLLLLIGVVVTNAIVLITFVEQLRSRGMSVYDALIEGGRTRVRPILMTAFTTTFALLPLATSPSGDGGIIGAELATVVIGGLASSTVLTLIVVPVIYTLLHVNVPRWFDAAKGSISRVVRLDRSSLNEGS